MNGEESRATSFSTAVGSYVAASAPGGTQPEPRRSTNQPQSGSHATKLAAGSRSEHEDQFSFLGGATPAWSADSGSFASVPFESAFGSVSTFPSQEEAAISTGPASAVGRLTSQESDDTALSSVMAALSVVEDQSAPELSEAPGAEDEGAPALPGRRFAHPSSSSSAGMGPPQMRDTQSNAMAGARGAGTVPVADTAWSAGAPWSTAAPGGVAASGPMGFGSGSALPPNMPGPGGHAYFPMGQGVPGGAGGSRAMAAPPPGMPMPMYFPYGAFPLHQGYAMPTGPVMGAGGYHAHMGPPGAGGSEPGQGVPSNAGPRNSSAASSGGGVDGSQQHLQMGQMPLPGWGHGVDAMPGSGPVPMPQLPHPMVPAMAIPYMAPAGQHGRPAMVLGPMGGGGPPHANAHYHDYGYSDDHGPAARQQPQPTAPAVVPGSGAALPRTGRSEEAGSASGSGRVPTDDAADGGESSGAAGGGAGSGRPRENRAGRAAGKASGGGGSGGGAKGDGSGRSRLLEEFRAHRQRSMSLSEIRGHVREFSRDQHGSRYIQQRVEVASEVEKDEAFEELEDSMGELMMDVFGNYVVQKFLDHGSARHQQALAEMMRGKVVELTLQMYGCRVVQKALEVLDGPQQAALIQELQGHILHCVRDQNGNHVVQKCIEQVPLRHMEFVVRDMYSHVAELAVHPYGCRVVQRVLEHCAKEAVARPVLDEVVASVVTLFEDQYGNYVVQHTLQHGFATHRRAICSLVKGRVLKLSQHKFASNVVERCLLCCSASDRRVIVAEIMRPDAGGQVPLDVMTKDPYANYVVQQAMDAADGERRQDLVRRLRASTATLKRFTYGKHILTKLEKMTKS